MGEAAPRRLEIDGRNIRDIASFYAEVERVLMPEGEWPLAHSLDALDDLVYGGHGAIRGAEQVQLVWRDCERNRSVLGVAATRRYWSERLELPGRDRDAIRARLAALDADGGPTFFDLVLEIIAGHANIELMPR